MVSPTRYGVYLRILIRISFWFSARYLAYHRFCAACDLAELIVGLRRGASDERDARGGHRFIFDSCVAALDHETGTRETEIRIIGRSSRTVTYVTSQSLRNARF